MDLNPYQFKAPEFKFELARFHLQEKSKIILCSMAWLKSDDYGLSSGSDGHKDYDNSNIKYWCHRLLPLFQGISKDSENDKVLFVACNRSGTEKGKFFLCLSTLSITRVTLI